MPLNQELNGAFKLFKKYSLINYDEDEDGEEMKIQLYPSLQFGWDIPQFQTVAKEYLKMDEEEAEEEDDSELAGAGMNQEEFEEDDA